MSMASRKLTDRDEFPSDPFKVFQHSLMVEMELAKMEHEKVYGIDRVIDLVDAEFRRKFNAQRERIWEASQARDEEKLDRAIRGMIAAYKALTKWATESNIDQMPKID